MTLSDSTLINHTIFRRGSDGPETPSTSTTPSAPVESCYDPRTDRSRGAARTGVTLPSVRPETERAIIAVIESPRLLGETVSEQFKRKENQLGSIFATLSPLESRALHKRLSLPQSGDRLAITFSRLVADRRQRLISFLADAPRRAATTAR